MDQCIVTKPSLLTISIVLIFLCGTIQPEFILVVQVILLLFAARRIKVKKSFFMVMLLLVLHSVVCILMGANTAFLALKQIVGITISYVFYRTSVNNKSNAMKALIVYKKLATIIAAFAVIQQVAFYAHINIIYDLRWIVKGQLAPANSLYRASTFFQEPSECALILLPMVFLALYSFWGKSKQLLSSFMSTTEAIILLLGFLATFSSAGYIGVFIGVVFIWLEYKHSPKKIIVFLLGIAGFIFAYTKIGDFSERINDTLALISDESRNLSTANISSQTIIINMRIAIKSFLNSWGLGSGIGSHPISYERFINGLPVSKVIYFFNKEDANSLLLRIISELGVMGITGVVAFLLHFWPKQSNSFERIIGAMNVSYFLLRLLRYGHYFNNGMWFFIVLFILMTKEEEGNNYVS
ncbi:MAG: hypothetical protein Q4C77_05910 [Eubacteriales bacterium]|nr:hypothetical protein [Eubacteriales bacterium]